MYSADVKMSPSLSAGMSSFTSSKFAAVGSPLNSFTKRNLRAFKALLEKNLRIMMIGDADGAESEEILREKSVIIEGNMRCELLHFSSRIKQVTVSH